MSTNPPIELITRGILTHGPRVLLCQSLKHKYMYLPGGHIDFQESAEAALQREFLEETGLKVQVRDLALVSECAFQTRKKPHHELNLVFHVEHPPTQKLMTVKSKEPGISFLWVELAAIPDLDIRPLAAKAYLAQLADRVPGHVEWVSEIP